MCGSRPVGAILPVSHTDTIRQGPVVVGNYSMGFFLVDKCVFVLLVSAGSYAAAQQECSLRVVVHAPASSPDSIVLREQRFEIIPS